MFTRREFFRVVIPSTATAVYFAFGGFIPPQETHAEEPKLEFLKTIWDTSMEWDQRDIPQIFGNFMLLLPGLFETPEMQTKEDRDIREFFSNGWGVKKDYLVPDAHIHISTLKISPSYYMSRGKKFLDYMANILPCWDIMLPQDVKFLQDGGSTNVGGIKENEELEYPDPNKTIEQAVITLFHEGGHLIENKWWLLKDYIPLESLLEYIRTFQIAAESVLEGYYSAGLEEMLKFKNGRPLLSYPNDSIVTIAKTFQTMTGLSLNTTTKEKFVNTTFWIVAKEAYRIWQKKHNDLTSLTPDENDFLNNGYVRQVSRTVAGEIQHLLIGPNQVKEGLLPQDSRDMPQNILSHWTTELDLSKLKLFSTVNPPTYQDFRTSLGLKPRKK